MIYLKNLNGNQIMRDKMPKAVNKVYKILEKYNLHQSVIQLDNTARSAMDASKALNTPLGSIVKSLIFIEKYNLIQNPIMVLISGDKKGNEKNITSYTETKGIITRPSAEFVKNNTGFSIGGVSPIIILEKKIPIIIDSSLKRFETLWASAGHTHWVFSISFEDLIRITNGKVSENISI